MLPGSSGDLMHKGRESMKIGQRSRSQLTGAAEFFTRR